MLDRTREMMQEAAWYEELRETTDTTKENIILFLWGPEQPTVEGLRDMINRCMGFIDCDRVEDKYDGGLLQPGIGNASYMGYWTVMGEKDE